MGYKTINEANEAVIRKIIAAEPFLPMLYLPSL